MARSPANRKYQLTINNPIEHGYSHESIKQNLSNFLGLVYWCMCDEIGKEGTPHTHIYLVFKNAVEFTTLKRRFYGAHIEPANGSNQENRDYIRKEGKWLDDEKNETNLKDTFEESGELPPDKSAGKKQSEEIYNLIKSGASNPEILDAFPSAFPKINYIEQTRQMILAEKFKNEFRKLEVNYLYGEPGVGKTRTIMENYGYENVYRVTDYNHPFDNYKGEDVLLFDEFRSSLPITEMLNYLDGYPLVLPCRYANKQACFTKVFIVSNIPLIKQYTQIQLESPETWRAFMRRINFCFQMRPDSIDGVPQLTQEKIK